MNIKTKYNIGSVVIAKTDGSYTKGKVVSIAIYVNKDELLPICNYAIAVKTKGPAMTDKNGKVYYSPFERTALCNEEHLSHNFDLYKKVEAELTEDELHYSQAKRDRLILWNMAVYKPKDVKETDKDASTDNASQSK